MSEEIVGVRATRHDRLHFVQAATLGLAAATPVVVDDGSTYLGFVEVPAGLLVAVEPESVGGRIVSAGEDDESVRRMTQARNQDALVVARNLPTPGVTVVDARWSADWARLQVTVEVDPDHESALAELRDGLARQLSAEIRFRRLDGSALSVPG